MRLRGDASTRAGKSIPHVSEEGTFFRFVQPLVTTFQRCGDSAIGHILNISSAQENRHHSLQHVFLVTDVYYTSCRGIRDGGVLLIRFLKAPALRRSLVIGGEPKTHAIFISWRGG